jgi:hypothetical protein
VLKQPLDRVEPDERDVVAMVAQRRQRVGDFAMGDKGERA